MTVLTDKSRGVPQRPQLLSVGRLTDHRCHVRAGYDKRPRECVYFPIYSFRTRSCWCVPCSTTRPPSTTAMTSASTTVESRCATSTTVRSVRPLIRRSIPSCAHHRGQGVNAVG
eukprot:1184887-Prorocentrum_minimum.AAC.1